MSGYNVCQKNFLLFLQHSTQKIIWPCFDFVEYSLQEDKCRFAKQPDVHLKPVSWWMVHFPEMQGMGIPLVILSLLALAVQA